MEKSSARFRKPVAGMAAAALAFSMLPIAGLAWASEEEPGNDDGLMAAGLTEEEIARLKLLEAEQASGAVDEDAEQPEASEEPPSEGNGNNDGDEGGDDRQQTEDEAPADPLPADPEAPGTAPSEDAADDEAPAEEAVSVEEEIALAAAEEARVEGEMQGADLVAAAADGVIALDGDVKLTSAAEFAGGAFTLDLAGHSIDAKGLDWAAFIQAGASLTVTGGGSISANSVFYNLGTLSVASGTFIAESSAGWAVFSGGASTTISGGTFIGGANAVYAINTKLAISGGSFDFTSASGADPAAVLVINPESGSCTITGGTFGAGASSGSETHKSLSSFAPAGSYSISGSPVFQGNCLFTMNGLSISGSPVFAGHVDFDAYPATVSGGTFNGGSPSAGAAYAFDGYCVTIGNGAQLTITGGTFNAADPESYLFRTQPQAGGSGRVVIQGGTFNCTSIQDPASLGADGSGAANVTVEGGAFKIDASDPAEELQKYLADGLDCTEVSGVLQVHPEGQPPVQPDQPEEPGTTTDPETTDRQPAGSSREPGVSVVYANETANAAATGRPTAAEAATSPAGFAAATAWPTIQALEASMPEPTAVQDDPTPLSSGKSNPLSGAVPQLTEETAINWLPIAIGVFVVAIAGSIMLAGARRRRRED